MTRSIPVLSLLALALAGCGKKGDATPAASAAPAPEVLVQTVTPEDVPIYVDSIGSVDALINAEIRARVPGYVREQVYRDGTNVKQGDVLFVIDPSLTAAAVKKAQGDAAATRALYAKSQADEKRIESLHAQGLAAKQDVDNVRSARLLAEANVIAMQGSLDTASANLSYTRIVSPIAGLAGVAKVRIGSLVGQGEPTLLTTVSQIDSIRVSYPVSEQWYLSNPQKFQGAAAGSAPTKLDLFLADGSKYPHAGSLSFLDRQVDPSTGTFTALASFPNPEGLLRPGQYAKVRDVRDVRKNALCVPQRAVAELQGTQQVVVVGPGDKAEVRSVVMGERVGSRWIVRSGLAAGERIVVEGLQKARNGMPVTPRLASSSATPSNANSVVPPMERK